MKEIWKDIKGYEGYYQISNFGKVKSVERIVEHKPYNLTVKESIRKLKLDTKGYYYLMLSKNGIIKNTKVHQLVANAFIPNPLNKPCVNHIDGNKLNNNVNNLEWVTYKENSQHARRTGLFSEESNKKSLRALAIYRENVKKPILKLKNDIVLETYSSIAEAARLNNLSPSNISATLRHKDGRTQCGGYQWKYANKNLC